MKRLLLAALLLPGAALAQTVTITVTPSSGIETVTPKVTWTSTGVSACTATGGWSGSKATSGTETLPAVDRSSSYGLVCTTSSGDAVLSWIAPTQNTNGTTLTDLTKFRIYTATTAAALASATPIEVAGSVTTYTLKDLPQGTKYFAVTAVNSANVESVMSNAQSKDITAQTATDQGAVSVTPRPKQVAVTVR